MSPNSFYILQAISGNPAMSEAMVEHLVVIMQRLPLIKDDVNIQVKIAQNLLRHPHLSLHRRGLLVREGAAAAGLPAPQRVWGPMGLEIETIFQDVEDIRLAASHVTLSQSEVHSLTARWCAHHEAYRVFHESIASNGEAAQQQVLRDHKKEIEKAFGMSAVLLVTHPRGGRGSREELIAELNRGEAGVGVWTHALQSVMRVSEQVPRLDHLLFEARIEGLKGKPMPPVGEELTAWEQVLQNSTGRPSELSDRILVQSAMRRSPETAAWVAESAELRARVEWTPEAVRQCLLSAVKEIRVFGLEGVAAIRSREEKHENRDHGGTESPQVRQTEEGSQREEAPLPREKTVGITTLSVKSLA